MKVEPIASLELLDRFKVMVTQDLFKLVGENRRGLPAGLQGSRPAQNEPHLFPGSVGSSDSEVPKLCKRVENDAIQERVGAEKGIQQRLESSALRVVLHAESRG